MFIVPAHHQNNTGQLGVLLLNIYFLQYLVLTIADAKVNQPSHILTVLWVISTSWRIKIVVRNQIKVLLYKILDIKMSPDWRKNEPDKNYIPDNHGYCDNFKLIASTTIDSDDFGYFCTSQKVRQQQVMQPQSLFRYRASILPTMNPAKSGWYMYLWFQTH